MGAAQSQEGASEGAWEGVCCHGICSALPRDGEKDAMQRRGDFQSHREKVQASPDSIRLGKSRS